jgi:hypothetical protein
MRRPITVAVGAITCAFFLSPAQAHNDKDVPLPCGDYDGVPSHNDCWPVSKKKQEDCQVWIDAGNGTTDADRKEKYKKKYFKCVGWPGHYESPSPSPSGDEGTPPDNGSTDGAPTDGSPPPG